MGNAFCFCRNNDQNINACIKNGDVNLGDKQHENNNKIKQNNNDKKNPESCTYSNSNHRNENDNDNENEQDNEIDDNIEENEEENNDENNENEVNNSNEEEKAEESEVNEDNNQKNANENNNKNTEIKKLENINIFKEKMQPYVTFLSETEFEESIPTSIKDIEKTMEEFDQNHQKIQEIISTMDPQTNITYPPLLFNDTKILYTGMWNISGLKEGCGTLIDSKGNKYQGGWFNDLFEGYGRLISIEGDWYEGEFKKGIIEGHGKYYCKKEEYIYTGNFKNYKFDGKGKIEYKESKIIYEGNFENGMKEGKGKLTFPNGNYYEGTFKKNNYNEGKFKFSDGRSYNGEWKNNNIHLLVLETFLPYLFSFENFLL